jgi:hypothetical protein
MQCANSPNDQFANGQFANETDKGNWVHPLDFGELAN